MKKKFLKTFIAASNDNVAELKKDGTSDTDKLSYGVYSAHSGTTAGTPIENNVTIVTADSTHKVPQSAACDVGFDRANLKSVGTYSGILISGVGYTLFSSSEISQNIRKMLNIDPNASDLNE